jgi:hypothetical protein
LHCSHIEWTLLIGKIEMQAVAAIVAESRSDLVRASPAPRILISTRKPRLDFKTARVTALIAA